MKNIHLVETYKPSKLRLGDNGNLVSGLMQNSGASINESYTNQHIYITSDEELVLSGYHFNSKYGDEPQKTNQRDIDSKKYWEEEYYYITKIILTTDQDLIKDGVQAVDDDFLEWFLNNSSCEKVETYSLGEENKLTGESCHYKYEIIIPQEEPKQNTMDKDSIDKFLDSLSDDELKEKWNKYNKHSEQKNSVTISEFIENIQQEAVKAAANREWGNVHRAGVLGFIDGAKSDAARDYWFEQFKKK
jgi:hypothetical protein